MRWEAVAALFVLGFGCDSCACKAGCGAPDHVAELASFQGEVVRDFRDARQQWRPVGEAETFRVGDGLRTGQQAQAKLRLVPSGDMLVRGDTSIRFRKSAPGEHARGMEIEMGSVEIEAGASSLDIQTLVGMARIERNSRVRLSAGEQGNRLQVLFGEVSVDRDGGTIAATSGDHLVLGVGGIVIEPSAQQQTEPTRPDAGGLEVAADAGTDANVDGGEGSARKTGGGQPGLTRAHLAIAAGETATIHDPAPPTNVAIQFPACERSLLVDVARGRGRYRFTRVRAEREAIVRLPAGFYRYRVRCLRDGRPGKVRERGRLRVRRDAGTRRLPRRAARVTVEADGRRYTVRYQNKLPRLTLRWPRAPSAMSYVLELTSPRAGKRTFNLSSPQHSFRSGELREGVHRFRFLTGDKKLSARGSLNVDFDNAARTAYVSSPRGTVLAGEPVRVAGAALSASRVRVADTPVTLDAQGRFVARVTPDADHDALAIRVVHSATGVHYYLRRLSRP